MKKIAITVAVVATIAAAGTALAAFPQDDVKLYTGCLNSGGNITYVKEGDTPLQPCSSPKQVVKLSGGDITSLSVSPPLIGGGMNGAVSISLSAAATLPSCSTNNDVPKWNVSTSRWACGTDNDTKYTNGTGLDLNAATNAFSINPDYRVKNDKSCDTDQFANGIDGSGVITCGTPASGGVHAYSAHVADTVLAGDTLVISKTIPPGTYLLFASVSLINKDANGGADGVSAASCIIPGYTTGTHALVWDGGDSGFADTEDSLALSSSINHAGGAVELRCTELDPNVDVKNATFTAIKVDSLG
jgi:hypothetical protein